MTRWAIEPDSVRLEGIRWHGALQRRLRLVRLRAAAKRRAVDAGLRGDEREAGSEAGSAGGNGPIAWEGAPCEECRLEAQVAHLTDTVSEDCGSIPADGGSPAVCAHAAIRAGRSFTVNVQEAATDSAISTTWVFAGRRLYVVAYDSNVCGGEYSCQSVGCGPRVVSRTCVDPAPSSVPTVVFQCGARGGAQTLCGPVP